MIGLAVKKLICATVDEERGIDNDLPRNPRSVCVSCSCKAMSGLKTYSATATATAGFTSEIQGFNDVVMTFKDAIEEIQNAHVKLTADGLQGVTGGNVTLSGGCLLYTSDAADE